MVEFMRCLMEIVATQCVLISIDVISWTTDVGCWLWRVPCHLINGAHKEFSNLHSIDWKWIINPFTIDTTTATCQKPFIGFAITHFYRGTQLNGKYSVYKLDVVLRSDSDGRDSNKGNHPIGCLGLVNRITIKCPPANIIKMLFVMWLCVCHLACTKHESAFRFIYNWLYRHHQHHHHHHCRFGVATFVCCLFNFEAIWTVAFWNAQIHTYTCMLCVNNMMITKC